MSTPPMSTPCSTEEQVQWVLMPVRVSTSSSFPPAPDSVGTQFPIFTPTFDFAEYPSMWDQQHAVPVYPMPPAGDIHGDAFDIDLALQIDSAIHQDWSTLPDISSSYDSVPPLDATFAAPSFTDGALLGDIWQVESPSVSGSSVGSPTATTSPFGAVNTPCSTPPTPELYLCSEPGCFESFSRTADVKRHERKHRQNFCCPLCQKPHLDKRALDRHLWSRHEKYAIKVGAKSEKTKCRMCDYVSRADNVRRHERSQHPTDASR